MNPLTLVKRIQQINSKEASLGISEAASWHTKYKESAYVFVGGIPFDLTEGDLLAVFAQYGEIVDVNLVRDKATGKSKGFAFIAYEDQRSTNLAVDNLNGAQILGRIVRVDHVTNYKKKEEEDEEEEQRKREERGVCRAFQKGECTRGAGCKFSHDEQRAANTGWGAEDQKGQWGHDRFDGGPRRKPDVPRPQGRDVHNNNGSRQQRGGVDDDFEPRRSRDRSEDNKRGRGLDERDNTRGSSERRYDGDRIREEKRSRRSESDDFEGRRRDDYRDRKEERKPREGRDLRREEKRQEPEAYYSKEDEEEDRKRKRGGRSGREDWDDDHPSMRHRRER